MRAVGLVAGLLAARTALGCGYCVEDKIAAAYDHAVVVRAMDARHRVAFLSLEGAPHGSRARTLARAVETTAGVDKGSVRVSLEGGALSFAFDPSRHGRQAVVDGVRKNLAAKGANASLLRVLEP